MAISTDVSPTHDDNTIPLCVDLDGTLIKTDLLPEATLALLKQKPLSIWRLPLWLMQGRAHLKCELAQHAKINPGLLPYNEPFLAYLREQHAKGRPLVLATASPEPFAQNIARHLGLFQQVIATTDSENLKGKKKARRLCKDFGERGFDYAGDSTADLAVWARARQALLVNPSLVLKQRASAITTVSHVFKRDYSRIVALLRALRPYQWSKNMLLFMPLLAAHHWDKPDMITAMMVAFSAFSLCASSVYLLNDLLDLPADRQHPRKRFRPFAAGQLPITRGLGLIVLLLVTAFILAALLPDRFIVVLGGYYILTLAYSLLLKRMVLVDVLLLAGFYTLRIIAGAAAITVVLSFWMLAFSMFLFLSLALVKRYDELRMVASQGQTHTRGRNYHVDDLDLLQNLGGSSGYLSVLVLALYINDPMSQQFYQYPNRLWSLCPILLFWISHVWFKVHRGQLQDDPVLFALRDKLSMMLAIIIIVVIWAAA